MISKFLVVFLSLGFVAKILGEVVHELMGHGLFLLAFGGRITDIGISLLWPYGLSYIRYAPPSSGFQPWQEALFHGAGILMCLVVSFTLQIVLLLSFSKRGNWVVSSLLFWLAFWTFVNSAGYLVVGGIRPFGDIASLIFDGAMTKEIALILGILIFLASLFSLSIIFRNVLSKAGVNQDARWSIVLFWLIIPVLTLLTVVGQGRPLLFTLLSVIPVLAACAGLLLHNVILSRRKIGETRP
jgi:hypothetical protein